MSVHIAPGQAPAGKVEVSRWGSPRVWASIAILAAIVPFAEGLTGARVFYIRDLSLFFWGRFLWLRRTLLSGEWPLWDPYIGLGVPHFASESSAVLAIPNQIPYVVSKGGVNQLTKVTAIALASHGIRVNAIGPGTILTEMAKVAVLQNEEARRKILSRSPLGRCGEPEEIAAVAAFLASDDASYITGQTIYPDGGRLALNYTVPVAD